MILSDLRAAPWKIGAILAGVLSLVIGGFLVISMIENREISRQRDQLQASITDPQTGYVARLTQAQSNVLTLTNEIKSQNQAYRQLSAESAIQLADTKRRLVLAQRESARLQRTVDRFLAQKIEGNTLEERVLDVDERAMKEFLGEE